MITRFAPSPTGPLHLGHAYSAIFAYEMAKAASGQFLLRIEDIDQSRSRPEWEAQIYEDLAWLGLDWPKPVLRQSDRLGEYQAALARLWRQGLLYPCTCNRRDILAASAAPQEGDSLPMGPDGLIYPGTCRPDRPVSGPMPKDGALRLNMKLALEVIGIEELSYIDTGEVLRRSREFMMSQVGDVVLSRRDMGTSYHLAVVVDDAAQGITHVTRGQDLAEATVIHVILQRLLDLPTPEYIHHRLIRDETGKRLAKRDDARAIATFRAEGASPADIRRMVGL